MNKVPVSKEIQRITDLLDATISTGLVPLASKAVDPRLNFISHSSRIKLHTCPKKFQLYRLNSKEITFAEESARKQAVTFAYGTSIGAGIQEAFVTSDENKVWLVTFLAWDTDALSAYKLHKKSLWEALFAVSRFINIRKEGYLKEYNLAYYKHPKTDELLPAIELPFSISLPENFYYRGYVDVVLEHKITKEPLVLELKTTGSTPVAANYRNSGQDIGYSIIVNKLYPEFNMAATEYLVYCSSSRAFSEFNFPKSQLQKSLWLQELLLEVELLERYTAKVFPSYGESCYNYFRECEYLGLCDLDIKALTNKYSIEDESRINEDREVFYFQFNIEDLIQQTIEAE